VHDGCVIVSVTAPRQNSAIEESETMYRFLVVIEKANGDYSAYSPDLPGCVAAGSTCEEAEQNMHEAIELHVKGLLGDSLPVPESNPFADINVN
jgi:predicted RNase H-like HicB family nuclease